MTPTRAGMVCFNIVGHVLVVSTLGKQDEWVFPKGHIEPNERSHDAAQREVLEEAGVRAWSTSSYDSLGMTEFKNKDESVVTQWWTGNAVRCASAPIGEFDESVFRIVKWLPWRIALDTLSYPDQRNMLRRALCLPEVDLGAITRVHERELSNF